MPPLRRINFFGGLNDGAEVFVPDSFIIPPIAELECFGLPHSRYVGYRRSHDDSVTFVYEPIHMSIGTGIDIDDIDA